MQYINIYCLIITIIIFLPFSSYSQEKDDSFTARVSHVETPSEMDDILNRKVRKCMNGYLRSMNLFSEFQPDLEVIISVYPVRFENTVKAILSVTELIPYQISTEEHGEDEIPEFEDNSFEQSTQKDTVAQYKSLQLNHTSAGLTGIYRFGGHFMRLLDNENLDRQCSQIVDQILKKYNAL